MLFLSKNRITSSNVEIKVLTRIVVFRLTLYPSNMLSI